MESQETTIQVEKVARLLTTLVSAIVNKKCQFSANNARFKKTVDNWIAYMAGLHHSDAISSQRLADFILYQAYRQREAIVTRKWQPANLFGNAAREAYEEKYLPQKGEKMVNRHINRWLSHLGLKRNDLTKMLASDGKHGLRKFIFMESEETIKRRFFNTENGLGLCQSSTTGWCPMSVWCSKCYYVDRCKNITRTKFPELMRLREENEDSYDKEQQ